MNRIMALLGGAGAVFALTGTAQAVSAFDIHQHLRPGVFYLDGSKDVEIIDYPSTRDITICASRDTPEEVVGAGQTESGAGPIALRVKADTGERVVSPGNCVMFEAKQVTVTPADEVPTGWVVQGWYSTR